MTSSSPSSSSTLPPLQPFASYHQWLPQPPPSYVELPNCDPHHTCHHHLHATYNPLMSQSTHQSHNHKSPSTTGINHIKGAEIKPSDNAQSIQSNLLLFFFPHTTQGFTQKKKKFSMWNQNLTDSYITESTNKAKGHIELGFEN